MATSPLRKLQRQRGNTLANIMISLVIIAILAGGVMFGTGSFGPGKSSRKDGKGTTVLGATKAKAQDTVCQSNLSQIRQIVEVQKTLDEPLPATIAELPSAKSLTNCPIGKEAYQFDSASGAVRCPHPGHEAY